jgi:hypothetical protein
MLIPRSTAMTWTSSDMKVMRLKAQFIRNFTSLATFSKKLFSICAPCLLYWLCILSPLHSQIQRYLQLSSYQHPQLKMPLNPKITKTHNKSLIRQYQPSKRH